MLGHVVKDYLLLEEQGEGDNNNRESPDNTSTGVYLFISSASLLAGSKHQVANYESRHRTNCSQECFVQSFFSLSLFFFFLHKCLLISQHVDRKVLILWFILYIGALWWHSV